LLSLLSNPAVNRTDELNEFCITFFCSFFLTVVGLAQVVELLWNLESTILAVWCETLPPDGSSSDFVPHSYGNIVFYYAKFINNNDKVHICKMKGPQTCCSRHENMYFPTIP